MPTIRKCCIIGCVSNSRKCPDLQFFQFPRPENPFQKLWKDACHASLRRILPFKKPVICALHFTPNCIGGRRLISSAVPSLRLEVPANLEAVEQQAMVEEIERSRKCAYINAVVYEWLVRANHNAQMRGSITHGMIKEKAESARQIIGSNSFVADNRWLNRFRETHLTGFAQKLATNQLKPMGSSLWIPEIVQDLQHLFPPTNSERANIEDMPEQYMNYMQQYGEQYGEYYEDTMNDVKDQSYQQQQQQTLYQLQQQQQQQQHLHHNQGSGYDPYSMHQNYNNYNDYYFDQRHQSLPYPTQHPPPQRRDSLSPNPHHHQHSHQQQERPFSPFPRPPSKRVKSDSPDHEMPDGEFVDRSQDVTSPIEDLTDENDLQQNNNAATASKKNGTVTPTNGTSSASVSPKHQYSNDNGSQTNGHTTPTDNGESVKELDTYTQALEYLKPLEDFALFKENFRAIGLISQLEAVLRYGDKATLLEG